MSEPSPARSRHGRGVVVALVVVGVVGLGVWVVPSYRAAASVEVLPRSMHCGPTQVPFGLDDGSGDSVPLPGFDVTLRPDSFCQLEVTFVNHGSQAVRIHTATFPGMGQGEGSGGPLEVAENGGRFTVEDTGSNDAGDAVVPVDLTLEADESSSTIFDLRTNRSSFIGDPNRMIGFQGIPRVRVTSRWIPATVDGAVNIRTREKK